jgi:hypothetical protein
MRQSKVCGTVLFARKFANWDICYENSLSVFLKVLKKLWQRKEEKWFSDVENTNNLKNMR